MRPWSLLLLAALAVPAHAELPSIATLTAGMPAHAGFVSWFWDAKQGRLLLAPPALGEDLLYNVSLAAGAGTIDVSLDRGQLGEMRLVRFERVGPRVLLIQRQIAHRSTSASEPERRAVARSFPEAVLASLPIVAETRDSLLVDATALVLGGDDVLGALKSVQPDGWRQDEARSALSLEGCGAFPLNTELEALVTFTNDRPAPGLAGVLPDGHTLSVISHHGFRQLPPPGYEPRLQDPRVGFFTQAFKDYATSYREPLVKRYAERWRLIPRNANAALSEPVQPLVYYLDPAIPEPERSTVRAAAMWWDRAFEAAGFRHAFELRDLPDGASFLDARYSGIQWTHRAERAWSIGQSQADPRTGEILHAVVLLDSHRRRTTDRMWRNLEPPPGGCEAGSSPDVAAIAGGPEVAESTLVLARLAYLTAHELGHTFGLEHDMAATTFGWGSVMDYLAPHLEVSGGRLDASDAYPKQVGSYDLFAIDWGYRANTTPEQRDATIRAAEAAGIAFPLDSDARWNEYDFGPDAALWLEKCRAVRALLLERFGPAQLRAREPYYSLAERFTLAYLYHRFALLAAQRQLGGEWVTNALGGDGQVPRVPVPGSEQRRALMVILACLAPEALEVPARIEQAMVPPPADFDATRERFGSALEPAFDRLGAAHTLAGMVLEPLLATPRAEALARASGDAPTLAEVLRAITAATWGAPSVRDPRLAPLQRIAQRSALDALLGLAGDPAASAEVRGPVFAELGALASTLKGRHGADAAAEAHVRLAERDLGEFLAHPGPRSRTTEGEPPPGRPVGER